MTQVLVAEQGERAGGSTAEVVGRRWERGTAPEGLRRARRQCGAVILAVAGSGLSWQGIDALLREVVTDTLGPEVSYDLHTRREAAGAGARVLGIVVWDVGPLALTVLARRLELAVETTVAWASVEAGCAAGRDADPDQLVARAERALARRRADRVRRRLSAVRATAL